MTQNSLLPIIIIGTGLAGYNLAKEIRKIDKTCALVLVTQDDGHFYSKPQLSTALFQGKSPQSLVITSFSDMQTQLNATIYSASSVESIDTLAQFLILQTPQETLKLHYAKLVFASGALPKPLPLLDKIKNHFRINTLQEYDHFIKSSENIQSVTIIGSGLVGCEFAQDFTKIFSSIQVLTPDPHPLYGLVPEAMGKELQAALENQGIIWHTQTHLTRAEMRLDEIVLHSSSGKSIHSNILLGAVGITPNIKLAQKAHIQTNHGIVVDNYLQTTTPHVFALGDCAEISGICRQYVAPILHCARALAQTLCLHPTPVALPLMPISLKVSSYPIITYPPLKHIEGEWTIEKNQQNVKALFHDVNGILQGYALSGSFLEERQIYLQTLGKTANTLIS